MCSHTLQSGRASLWLNKVKIHGNGLNNNRMKRKISDALLVNQYRTTQNIQGNSIALELFN